MSLPQGVHGIKSDETSWKSSGLPLSAILYNAADFIA